MACFRAAGFKVELATYRMFGLTTEWSHPREALTMAQPGMFLSVIEL
jgi:hypothetical protein